MGVSGCGKTTVGTLLAEKIGGAFLDADDLHPASNIDRMKRGAPLTDEDRIPWLDRVAAAIRGRDPSRPLVVACSALKQAYRERLGRENFRLVHLTGPSPLIAERMKARPAHHMPVSLLESQFRDLEEPADALTVSVAGTPEDIVREIERALCG